MSLVSRLRSASAGRRDASSAFPAQPLNLEVVRRGEDRVLVAVGDIDLTNVDRFVKAVDEILNGLTDEAALVIDLCGTDFVGTVGLRILLDTQRRCADRDLALRVVTANRALLRVLQVTGLDQKLVVVRPTADLPIPAAELLASSTAAGAS